MTENPGQLVAGQYQLVAEIGRGGFGVVWRARHERLGRDVAAKKLFLASHAGTLGADQWQERSRRTFREARSAARIDHPAAVRIYDIVEHEGDPWIIMELVEGRSLNAVVRSEGPLPPRRVAEIGLRIVGALNAAHKAGVVHRDVNPANVLIGERGAVLTDFGIAVIQGDPSLTHTGVVMGAPAYTSPERARGEQAVPASDLWSLGATLYYAVEGGRPFPGPNPNAVLYSILTTDPPVPRLAGPLTPVLNGLLHRDACERLTADDTTAMLEALLQDDSVWGVGTTTIRTGTDQRTAVTDPLPDEVPHPEPPRLRGGSVWRKTLALSVVPAVVLALLVVLSQRDGTTPAPPEQKGAAAAAKAPRLIGTLTGDRVYALAFSHDGSMLAAGGDGSAVRLWDVARQRQTGALRGQKYAVFSIAFSPDDRTLAGGGYDGQVFLWNTTTQRRRSGFGTDGNSIGSLAFSPDGRVLACAGSDAVRLWSTADKSWLSTLRSPAEYESTFTTAFSRQGRLAVAGSATIRLWNTVKAKSVTLTSVSAVVSSLAFSRDGGTLAAGGFDGSVRLYDTIRRRPLATLTGHDKSITAVAFSPRVRALASAGGETVRLWDTGTGRPISTIRHGSVVVNALAFSPDGRLLATGGDDGAVRLYAIHP
ncbi:WD40 repeat domain-containing serine/threonine protein kinase [Actinomadura sp. 6N118]|uniref:WD40 repeat domain-containing serine/threonine protein kinase n=1 Tax=Actinomadura sp. 6N118 TaxID=3375151 RepID=UPI0037B609F1